MPKDLLAGRKAGPRDLLAGRRSAADQLDWSDVPGQAVSNLGSSVGNLVNDTVQAVAHPIETAQGLGRLVGGVAAKAGIGDMDQSTADAVGQMLADRYGGIENLKKTMATDPAGFASDLSMILTAGGSLAARAPGVAGKIGNLAAKTAEFVDPISLGAKTAIGATRLSGGVAAKALGVTTGAGGDAIEEMQKAGRAGNQQALYQMRNQEPASDLVDEVQSGLGEMLSDRKTKYDQNMAPVETSQERLSWREPVRALRRGEQETQHKGVVIDSQAADAVKRMRDLMRDFVNNGMNTPFDMHQYKKGVNIIRGDYQQGSNARRIVDNMNDAVSGEIGKSQVGGDYNSAMRGYQADSGEIGEIRRTLSANDRATMDTQLRKVLSLKRSNVNTNFGGRQQAAAPIFSRRPKLEGMIAGRVLSGWEPQGLARAATAIGLGTAGPAGAMLANPALLPAAALSLATTSPRAMGEVAYKVGQARRGVDAVSGAVPLSPAQRRLVRQTVTQVSRAEREEKARKDRKYRTKP